MSEEFMAPPITGRLNLVIIEARYLQVFSEPASRPYCVVEFQKNEFISKEGKGSNPVWNHPTGLYASRCMFLTVAYWFSSDVSRADDDITITVWDRAYETEVCLGAVRIALARDEVCLPAKSCVREIRLTFGVANY